MLKWRLRSRIEARSLILAFFWSPPAVVKNKARDLGDVAECLPNRVAYVFSNSFSKLSKVLDSAKTEGWI